MTPDELRDMFKKRLASGLKRASITTCSQWAEAYRVMKMPDLTETNWSFRRSPWTKAMHDSTAEFNVGQKGAQLGFTETLLNIAMFYNDVKKMDVLYVLPNQNPDATNFSAGRFDAALDLSPYLDRLYSDAKNVGYKRAGKASMYIRGSQSRSGLKSIPVAAVLIDEVAEMDQDNVPLAIERTSGQETKLIWMVSTPTIHNHGINKHFLESSQEHFFFRCPHCSKMTELVWPECIEAHGDDPDGSEVMQSRLLCKECKGYLDHDTKMEWLKTGIWVPSVTGKDKRGFHVNQLYSPTIKPGHIVASHLRGLSNPADEQEFWNSKMGMPHEVAGSRVTEEMLQACMKDHLNGGMAHGNRVVTMGVDVGRICHYEVCEWRIGDNVGSDINVNAVPRVLKVGTDNTQNLTELDRVMHEYRVMMCVIDAHPERRKAFEFSQRFRGHVKMNIYGRGVSGRMIQEPKSDIGEPLITVDRTSWLDMSLGRYKNQTILLPKDLPFQYRDHVKCMARIWKKDPDENPVGTYVKEKNKDDHFAHARNYAEIAFALVGGVMESYDMESVL